MDFTEVAIKRCVLTHGFLSWQEREMYDCLLVYSKSDKVIARYKRLGRGFETQVDASLPDAQGTGKTRTKTERFLGTDDTLT